MDSEDSEGKFSDFHPCKKLESEFSHSENENMRVYLRVRPFKVDELENEVNRHCLSITDSESVLIRPPHDSSANKNSKETARIHQRFTFSHVYGPDFDQKDFFESSVLPIVKDSLKGETSLIFAYGATNSGKTYTMQGTTEEPGIIPRTLAVIFKSIENSCDYDPNNSQAKEMARLAFYDGSLHTMQEYPEPRHSRTIDNEHSIKHVENNCISNVAHDSEQVAHLLSESIQSECDDIVSICVSFAEIYNENIYDLLDPLSVQQKRRNLKLAIDRSTNRTVLSNHIKGLRYVCVNSVSEACRILKIGHDNLHFASNKLNQNSSRSHCIFSVYMIRSGSVDNPHVNSLTFCDLAGLERVTRTQNTGSRLKEAGNINTSLLVLGRCIEALREKRVVPYRDSKLTRLFQGYFTENGKATMIVNVSQSSEMLNDTVHVLKFSASAQQVVSIDNFDRSKVLWHDQSAAAINGRFTDYWPLARQRWSEYAKERAPSKLSIQEEDLYETSLTENSLQEETAIQDLVDIVWKIEKENQELKKEKIAMESELRRELCQEFEKMMCDMEKQYEERIKRTHIDYEEMMDRRLSYQKKSLTANLRAEYEEEGDTTLDTTTDVSKVEESLDESIPTNENDTSHILNTQERYIFKKERESLLDEKLNLMQERDALSQSLKKLQQEMATLNKKCSDLQKENDAMCKESALLQKENERLLRDTSHSTREVSNLTKENEALKVGKLNLEQEIQVLQKAYDSLLREKDPKDNHKLHELTKKLQIAEEERKEVTKEKLKLEEKLTAVQKERDSYEVEQKKKKRCLEEEVSQLAKDKKMLVTSNSTLKKEMESLRKSYDSLLGEMNNFKDKHEKVIETHKKEMSQMEKNMAAVQSKSDRIDSQNASLVEEKKKLRSEVKNLKEKVVALELEKKISRADDFQPPKRMTTRGRKRTTGVENSVPSKNQKVETAVAVQSPLAALGQAIRQSPTFKAVENIVGRVMDKFSSEVSSPVLPRRTRRKLYCQEESMQSVQEPATESAACRQSRRKK